MSRSNNKRTPTSAFLFTPAMDEVLRQAANEAQFRKVKWEEVSRNVPGTTPRQCKARWDAIKGLPGLQYTAFANPTRTMPPAVPKTSSDRDFREQMAANPSKNPRALVYPPSKKEEITIHVCDEARGINKDFSCDRYTLTKEMKYFQSYLTEATSYEEIDISVHCDVLIFEWLLKFIGARSDKEKPNLDVEKVVSILISSEFLQMDALVDLCLGFFKDHASAIIASPIDLNCINTKLVSRLAARFEPSELDLVKDKRDKILGKLYMCKVELLLAEHGDMHTCARCGAVYLSSLRAQLLCPKAAASFDFHGNLVASHTPMAASSSQSSSRWDAGKAIVDMRCGPLKMSFREVHWRVWAMMHALYCATCKRWFAVSEHSLCWFHPSPPHFTDPSKSTGFYPCCNTVAHRFDALGSGVSGCQCRPHTVDTSQAIVHPAGSNDPRAVEHQGSEKTFTGPGHTSDSASDSGPGFRCCSGSGSSQKVNRLLQLYSDLVGDNEKQFKGDKGGLSFVSRDQTSNIESHATGRGGALANFSLSKLMLEASEVRSFAFGESYDNGSDTESDEDFGEDEGDSDSSPRNSTKSRAVHSKSRAAPRLNQSRAQSAGVVRSRRGYAHSGQSSNTTQPWVSISPRKSPGRAAKKEFEATKRKAKKSSFKRSSESGTRAPLKMDVVRTSDRKRMTSLMAKLQSLRNVEPTPPSDSARNPKSGRGSKP